MLHKGLYINPRMDWMDGWMHSINQSKLYNTLNIGRYTVFHVSSTKVLALQSTKACHSK